MKQLIISVYFIFIITFATSVWAQKTDVLYMNNGDKITGEIKALESGQLRLSTDYAGTIVIEWSEIVKVISDKGHTIQMVDGRILYGSLSASEDPGEIAVVTPDGEVNIKEVQIVTMHPVKTGFWNKVNGSAEFGLTYDKASNIGKYSVYADATYRTVRQENSVRFNSIFTSQADQKDNKRAQRILLDGSHLTRLPEKRFRSYFASLEHNDELGLDLRSLLGIGYGYSPVRSNKNWLDLSAGLAYNWEQPISGTSTNNLEAVLALDYRYYKYRSPQRSFNVRLHLFPSITDGGRYRAMFDTDFRLELYKDLYWSLRYYASYDSRPLSKGAENIDYGINTSVGVKF